MGLLDLVSLVFKPAADLIDELHTSEEERLNQKGRLLEVQAAVIDQALSYEKEMFTAKAKIVEAEASSESILAANWRPVVMLTFTALVVADSFGLAAVDLADQMWSLLQIGLGGYVVGRSGEKITKSIIQAKVTGK
jgi:hypothetical protein